MEAGAIHAVLEEWVMPVYDADAPCGSDYYDRVWEMTDWELWHYQGPIMPANPTDADVLRRASLLDRFVKRPEFRKKEADWSNHRGDRLFGEYYFGLRFGLPICRTVWEKDFRVDYTTDHGTIDVKSIFEVKHNLLHPIKVDMCDILVLAMVHLPLSLKNVSLLGWCYRDQMKLAPVREFSKEDPKKVDAHIVYQGQLRKIEDLEVKFKIVEADPPRALLVEPHWHEPPTKKGQQQSLFKI